MNSTDRALVLGAGPAGLTAAWELEKIGIKTEIVESSSQVGGISKTVLADEYRFDLGGHRFFTKVEKVKALWAEMLPPSEMLSRPRKSRILYRGNFFDYPLKPVNALFGLGLLETFRSIASYIWVRISPPKDQTNFEGWVAARFGWRLYRIFFKTYTEKVWGVPAESIGSDWAAQRIKSLSLSKAILNAFYKSKKEVITTLIDNFQYPKYGPGQLWENAASILEEKGFSVTHNLKVTEIHKKNKSYEVKFEDGSSKEAELIFSSLPLAKVAEMLDKDKSNLELHDVCRNLKHRDFLTVALIFDAPAKFDDNWIYVHEKEVTVGRVQNFESWSPYLVKAGTSCLGLEYFVNQGDKVWNMSDEDLVQFALSEANKIGIVNGNFISGHVVRVPNAYPVYDSDYKKNVDFVINWLTIEHPNVYQIGRSGQHRYNNQDHSMMTAVEAVLSLVGKQSCSYWEVNVDDEYHEESNNSSGRAAPVFEK
jgi:protoporphyrinogen oxidase